MKDSDSPTPPAVFATTRWTVVMNAGSAAPEGREALETLCRTYWYPLYAFVRKQGHSAHDAQDLTQAFFARFLEKNYLAEVHRERGRFRSFLLAALKHFLANEWDRVRAQKRGGGQTVLSLEGDAEDRYQLEPKDDASPEKIYERRWAVTLLDRVLTALRLEFAASGKADQFERLKPYLISIDTAPSYAETGTLLGMSDDAVKMAAHRLRKRYRELLRNEIAHTVSRREEVEDEIRYLFGVLAG